MLPGFNVWGGDASCSRQSKAEGSMAEFPQSFETTSAGLHTGRGIDVADLLPPAAAAKVTLLRQHASDLRVAIPKFEDRLEAAALRTGHEKRLTELTRPRVHGGHGLSEDHPQAMQERKAIAKITAELERIDNLIEVRSAKWQTATKLLQAIDQFVIGGGMPRGCDAEEAEPPKVKANGNLSAAIEAERHRVRELRADAHRITSSPYPAADSKRRMREAIENLAARGRPSVARMVEQGAGEIDFADEQYRVPVFTDREAGIAALAIPDVLGLIAFLFKPALIAALDSEISSESDDGSALSEKQRAEQLAQIETDILAHERIEAALVWSAQVQGIGIEQRPDISVLALLGLRLVTRAHVAQSGTSPEHVMTFAHPER
jgi:hypothetical protein